MKKKFFSIRDVVAIGIGTALFIVLSYVSIPVGFIPNTNLQTRAALLGFFSAVYGPIVGGVVGFLGHALADAIQYGGVWWSWVFPEAVFGIIVGLFAMRFKIKEGGFKKKEIILFNVVQVIGNVVAWVIVAPILDIIIYAEPTNKVFTQGVAAMIANIVIIGVLSTLLAIAYTKMNPQDSSLSQDE